MKITVIDSKSGEILSVDGTAPAAEEKDQPADAVHSTPLRHLRFSDGREIEVDTQSGDIISG